MRDKSKIKNICIDLLYFLGGSTLYALALYTFALHANFAPGGVSGLTIIIHHYTGWPIGVMSIVLNIPIVLACFKTLGLKFILKSLVAMGINTVFLDLIFPHFPVYTGNPLVASVFAGVLMGAGLAIIYMRGASTGGSDFITMSIKKWKPHLSIGRISLMIDAAIILAGGFVFQNVDAVLYGIVCSFAGTTTIDNVLYGAGSGKLTIIVTNYGQKIADAISAEVERGSTLIDAIGAYTGKNRQMLFCACNKNEVYKVRATVLTVDPDALLMVTEVSEVLGEGFDPTAIPGNEIPKDASSLNGSNN